MPRWRGIGDTIKTTPYRKPTDAVMSTIRDVEHGEKLGSVSARLERMRKLCGV
jgi:hypothetical protein